MKTLMINAIVLAATTANAAFEISISVAGSETSTVTMASEKKKYRLDIPELKNATCTFEVTDTGLNPIGRAVEDGELRKQEP